MLELFENTLDNLLHPSKFPEGILASAARYAVLGGGKRLRPQLLMVVATLNQQPLEPTLIPACALEMIHTYSIIHDDLPCMDDDDLRRGKPSLHKIYQEGPALLTGNFLLTYAFEILSTAPHLTPDARLQVLQIITSRIGAWGMIGGQELDLRWGLQTLTSDTLQDLHWRKTGALIAAAIECGIIIGQSPDPLPLKKLATLLGQLYQLLDDLQDPQDLQQGRPTALALWGFENTQSKAQHLFDEATTLCQRWPSTTLEKLLAYWNPAVYTNSKNI